MGHGLCTPKSGILTPGSPPGGVWPFFRRTRGHQGSAAFPSTSLPTPIGTRTRTNTHLYGTEASASGGSMRTCDQKFPLTTPGNSLSHEGFRCCKKRPGGGSQAHSLHFWFTCSNWVHNQGTDRAAQIPRYRISYNRMEFNYRFAPLKARRFAPSVLGKKKV